MNIPSKWYLNYYMILASCIITSLLWSGPRRPGHDRVHLLLGQARDRWRDRPGINRTGPQRQPAPLHPMRAADAREPGGHARGPAARPRHGPVLDAQGVQGHE